MNLCIFTDTCLLFEFAKLTEEYCVKLCNVPKSVESLDNRGGVSCRGYCRDIVGGDIVGDIVLIRFLFPCFSAVFSSLCMPALLCGKAFNKMLIMCFIVFLTFYSRVGRWFVYTNKTPRSCKLAY